MLESLELPLGAVLGTFGVERHRITWRGQAAHAGSTPMDQRRDALAGAAKLALELREIATRVGGGAVLTSGRRRLQAGDRHLGRRDRRAAARPCAISTPASSPRCWEQAREACERFAAGGTARGRAERIWQIEPILFDPQLIDLCDESIREVAGESHRLPSGPLHDAAEVSRAGVPTVMLFVQSLRGLSHTKLEDTRPEHLELAVQALDRLASKTIAWLTDQSGSRKLTRPPSPPAAVVFDCDGLLLETEIVLDARRGGAVRPLRQALRRRREAGADRDVARRRLARPGAAARPARTRWARSDSSCSSSSNGGCSRRRRRFPGAEELVLELKPRVPLAVASNTPGRLVRRRARVRGDGASLRGRRQRRRGRASRSPRRTSTSARASSSAPSRRGRSRSRTRRPASRRRARPACS